MGPLFMVNSPPYAILPAAVVPWSRNVKLRSIASWSTSMPQRLLSCHVRSASLVGSCMGP